MKFIFGDIVVVYENQIGVVVKSWENIKAGTFSHEVYVRSWNEIVTFDEQAMKRYIYNKELCDEEHDTYLEE